jgi:arylsulfatase A-like enzyme
LLLVAGFCVVAPFVFAAIARADQPAKPLRGTPNLVVILADDLGYGDLGCYGAKLIATPHIDRLAREGMRFTDAHSPSAVCTPTRYGLLTGRYAWRTKLARGTLVGDSPALLEPNRLTLASLVKRRGYATACVGKWHLGLGVGPITDFNAPLRPGPLSAGFDEFFGIPASLDMVPYVYVRGERVLALPTAQSEKSPKPNYFDGLFWREGPAAPGFRHADVLPAIEREAVDFLARQTAGRPFFLYLALTSPHTPWVPVDPFKGRTSLGAYGDFVEQTDAVVGSVLAQLDTMGQRENTLVIFTSDNGSMRLPDHVERAGHRSNGRLRGQKADIWEGGHRVPFIARWPGRIAAGSLSNGTICHTDLVATIAELLVEELPDDAGEDSFSLASLLFGRDDAEVARRALVHHSGDGVFALREHGWKAIFHLGSGGFSAPKKEEPTPGGPQGQLYNLVDDPEETRNLWLEQPAMVERLSRKLEEIKSTGRSRPKKGTLEHDNGGTTESADGRRSPD